MTLLLVVCFYTDVIALPIKIVLMMIALSVFGVGLYVAMWGDRKIGYFKCPHCKTRTWCKKVMTKEG